MDCEVVVVKEDVKLRYEVAFERAAELIVRRLMPDVVEYDGEMLVAVKTAMLNIWRECTQSLE